MSWQSSTTSHGLRIQYASAQDATATLICLHGWSLDSRSFDRQLPLTNCGLDLITLDRRGFGNNSRPANGDCDLDDLHRLVLKTELPVFVYGVSQGARLALRYSMRHSAHIAGLIFQGGVVDAYPFDASADDEPPIDWFRELMKRGELTEMKARWLEHPLMHAGLSLDDRQLIQAQLEAYQGTDLMETTATSLSRPNGVSDTAKLSIPALVTVADLDSRQRKQHAERLIADNGATALRLPGGHLSNFSHASAFNQGVCDWLKTFSL